MELNVIDLLGKLPSSILEIENANCIQFSGKKLPPSQAYTVFIEMCAMYLKSRKFNVHTFFKQLFIYLHTWINSSEANN